MWLLTACLVNPSPTWIAAKKTSKCATIWWHLVPGKEQCKPRKTNKQRTNRPFPEGNVTLRVFLIKIYRRFGRPRCFHLQDKQHWRLTEYFTLNVGNFLSDYMASRVRIRYSWRSPMREPLWLPCLTSRPTCSCVGGHDMLQLKVGQLQFGACGLQGTNKKGSWHKPTAVMFVYLLHLFRVHRSFNTRQ